MAFDDLGYNFKDWWVNVWSRKHLRSYTFSNFFPNQKWCEKRKLHLTNQITEFILYHVILGRTYRDRKCIFI